MQRRETNQVTMIQAVLTVLHGHGETVSSYEPIDDTSRRLEEAVATIQERDRDYTEIATGVTAAKKTAEAAMVEQALHLARALNAHAVKTGNEPLSAETKVSRSGLTQHRESETIQYCIRIGELARDHAEELSVYAITPDTVAELDGAIDRMKTAVADQVKKAAEKKTARLRLTEAIDTAMGMVKSELDTLIELVKDRDGDLYDEYRAVRAIKDLGHTHRRNTGGDAPAGEEEAAA